MEDKKKFELRDIGIIRVMNHEHFNCIGHPGWDEYWIGDEKHPSTTLSEVPEEWLKAIGEGKKVKVRIEITEL